MKDSDLIVFMLIAALGAVALLSLASRQSQPKPAVVEYVVLDSVLIADREANRDTIETLRTQLANCQLWGAKP